MEHICHLVTYSFLDENYTPRNAFPGTVKSAFFKKQNDGSYTIRYKYAVTCPSYLKQLSIDGQYAINVSVELRYVWGNGYATTAIAQMDVLPAVTVQEMMATGKLSYETIARVYPDKGYDYTGNMIISFVKVRSYYYVSEISFNVSEEVGASIYDTYKDPAAQNKGE